MAHGGEVIVEGLSDCRRRRRPRRRRSHSLDETGAPPRLHWVYPCKFAKVHSRGK